MTTSYPFKAYVIGPLVVTTCNQAAGAPFIDSCFTRDKEGRRYKGRAILLKPWHRKWGQSLPQTALVIGWRQ